jgi:2-oxoglutarate dehydrogenase E1 component
VYNGRLRAVESKKGLNWACAEALAFASLLTLVHLLNFLDSSFFCSLLSFVFHALFERDGVSIRIAGQDVERGTFNQRHAVLYGQENVMHVWLSTSLNSHLICLCEGR